MRGTCKHVNVIAVLLGLVIWASVALMESFGTFQMFELSSGGVYVCVGAEAVTIARRESRYRNTWNEVSSFIPT